MGVKYDLSTEAGMTSLREEVARRKFYEKRPVATFVEDSKTERQRGYQWGWLYKQAVLALSEAGIGIEMADGSKYPYDSEILHELLKKNIAKPLLLEAGLIREMMTKTGREIPQKISTEDMSKPMFSEYVKGCKAFFWEYWGFNIPAPEDAYYRAIEEEMRAQR
jgi:hypothetical protein